MPVESRESTALNFKEVKRFPYVAKCEETWCFYYVATKTREEAEDLLASHTCPHIGPSRIGPQIVTTLMQQTWKMMDENFAVFRTMEKDDPAREKLGATIRGMAMTIQPFLVPYFTSADEVIRELLARADDPERNTPGVGRYVPPAAWEESKRGGWSADAAASATAGRTPFRSTPAASTAQPRAQRTLTDEQAEKIRAAHAAGFDMKMLTTAYDCTEADIRSVLA